MHPLPTLKDCVRRPVHVLLVGINPGVRSALTGRHFAGYSNRFWKLLHESGLVSEPLTYRDDRRLPQWGIGITNLVARPTAGIDALRPDEYREGLAVLRRKVRRWQPRIVAFVGITSYRVVSASRAMPVRLGVQAEPFEGATAVVLPNPSGRNANYTYAEMLASFEELARIAAASR